VVLVCLVALYFAALYSLDWYWPRFGVPGGGVKFLDIRFFTTAWDCVRVGMEVIPANPCDSQFRAFNYPRLWLYPGALGLGLSHTVALGALIAAAFFVSIFALIGRISATDAVLYAALICSPAVMLGVERANPDLIVFTLVFAGVVLARRQALLPTALGHGLLLLAALLKIYPVFAWGALLLRSFRRTLPGLVVLTALFAAYLVATREHLQTMNDALPRLAQHSFGAPILADSLGWDGLRGQVLVIALGLAVAVVLVGIALLRDGPRLRTGAVTRELSLFWAGAGVYVGTWAFTYNFNYRLVFLLLTVPQLLRWTGETSPPARFAKPILTLVLLTLWLGSSLSFYPFGIGEWWERVSAAGFQYDEVLNLILFGYLVAAGLLTVGSLAANAASARAKVAST
jgi:hypothetical protein